MSYFTIPVKLNLTLVPAVIVCSAALLLSACATTVSKDQRDTSGKYDGRWTATISKASTPQTHDGWVFRCRDLSGVVPMIVADGEVTITFEEDKYNT